MSRRFCETWESVTGKGTISEIAENSIPAWCWEGYDFQSCRKYGNINTAFSRWGKLP